MSYLKFPFGKYKGTPIYELPTHYIVHALEAFDLPADLENALVDFLLLNLNLFERNHVFFNKELKDAIDLTLESLPVEDKEKAKILFDLLSKNLKNKEAIS
jgi:hypothetical protein